MLKMGCLVCDGCGKVIPGPAHMIQSKRRTLHFCNTQCMEGKKYTAPKERTKWVKGEPTKPGWYLLEFSGGERFNVARAFYDDENIFRMEHEGVIGEPKAYISDVVDVIVQHLAIPSPD